MIRAIHPSRLEQALEAAHKRIIAADKQVGAAVTDEELEEATGCLESSVRTLEKVTECLQKIDSCVRRSTYCSRNIAGYINRRNNNNNNNDTAMTNNNNNNANNNSTAGIIPPVTHPSSAGLNATLGVVDSEESDELDDEREVKRQKYDHLSHHHQHQHHQQQLHHHQQAQQQQQHYHHHHHLNTSHMPLNDATGGGGVGAPSSIDGDATRDGKQGIPVE